MNENVYELAEHLNTNIKTGLTTEEANKRLLENGKNRFEDVKTTPWFFQLFSQLKEPMIFILIIAGFISIFLKEYIDSAIIFFVVFLNALIGFAQERKAYKALQSLKSLSSPHCKVKRDNREQEIFSEDIVIGDILILEEGDIVPADARLIKINRFIVDESSLTGESKHIHKCLSCDQEEFHRKDTIYASTEVMEGKAEAICIETGSKTEIGKIAGMVTKRKENTPLENRLDKLGKNLGILTIVICVLMLILSLLQGGEFIEMLITSISLGVAAIPEGLPAVVTIVLSLGVQKMVKANTIVRKLPSVETLGSVTVVCTDKTGTLTENQMKIEQVYFDQFSSYFEKYKKELSLFLLCTNATLDHGDPTERAIVKLCASLNIYRDALEKKYPRIDEIPFTSTRKKMETIHLYNGNRFKIVKGAPEVLLEESTHVHLDSVTPLEKKNKEIYLNVLNQMSYNALRTLGLMIETQQKRIFVGILAMKDPLRKEAKKSVQTMLDASVKVKMITGDHKDTAFAIAREIGIASKVDEVMEGKEIDTLDKPALLKRLPDIKVFARVTPEHKMRIIQGYKTLGEVVAMTGDGVNDAPSLKAADVGIAMGKSGTEVAKEAADLIIRDDDFATIVQAMKEGRNIYSNIRKAVLFLLSSNIAEVLVMFLGLLFGFPLPLLAIHILFVNLISDSLPALALGTDKMEEDLMLQKPRSRNDSLFSMGGKKILVFYAITIFLLTAIAFFATPFAYLIQENVILPSFQDALSFFTRAYQQEWILKKSRTLAFTVLSLSELFHMIGMSSPHHSFLYILKKKNFFLFFTFTLGLLLQFCLTEIPLLCDIFKTSPLSLNEWILCILLSSFPLVAHEILKKEVQ